MTAVAIARRAAHAAFWSVFRRPPGWNEPRNRATRFWTTVVMGLALLLVRYLVHY